MFNNFLTKRNRAAGRRSRRRSRRLKAVAVAVVLLAAVSVYLPATGSSAEKSSPWADDDKPVVSFLLTNEEVLGRLGSDLGLDPAQTDSIRDAAMKEAEALARLKDESQSLINREDLGTGEKQAGIEGMAYNERLRQIVTRTRQEVEAALTPRQKSMLPGWVANQFLDQRRQFEEAATASANAASEVSGSYRVYATQYYSNYGSSSLDVAVPDKYVKFASLGWQYHSGYPQGGNYSVNLSYGGRQLHGVPVKDVGPWNIDDNYWNGGGGARPRRLFQGLPTGLPEAQAAFFDDYNGGLDQFGRIVSNPAGIDLTPRAGVELGLGYLVSGWVTVSFNWEPPPGGGGGGIPIYGAIANKYNQLGGAPGQPRNAEYDVPGGRAQDFTTGRIMWSRETGVTAWVYGAILARYDALGGAGALSLPLGDEEAAGSVGGRRTRFQRGHIYWSPATGTNATYGAILGRYLQLGGPDALGLPVGDEEGAGGGRLSRFQRAYIYWSPETGTHATYGAILSRYLQLGGPAVLGLPVGDEQEVVGGGRLSRFQRAYIYWSPATGPAVTYGAILGKYLQLGGPEKLGLPVADEGAAASGRLSRFQRAHIYWSPATGPYSVYGAILGRYLQLGGPTGMLGFPVSDEFSAPGVRRSNFQNGAIEWSILNGSVTLVDLTSS